VEGVTVELWAGGIGQRRDGGGARAQRARGGKGDALGPPRLAR
jgi:hypothetical protein